MNIPLFLNLDRDSDQNQNQFVHLPVDIPLPNTFIRLCLQLLELLAKFVKLPHPTTVKIFHLRIPVSAS